jgi:hypothetical protein
MLVQNSQLNTCFHMNGYTGIKFQTSNGVA